MSPPTKSSSSSPTTSSTTTSSSPSLTSFFSLSTFALQCSTFSSPWSLNKTCDSPPRLKSTENGECRITASCSPPCHETFVVPDFVSTLTSAAALSPPTTAQLSASLYRSFRALCCHV
ncbi:hypothetical protein MRB53_041833 [Persea americana]|nr:hypothetical protein MRB53_041833 [Persea americana]